MLGGGIYVTQNKTLPGTYFRVINSASASTAVGDRGVVAIALPLGKSAGKVIEVTKEKITSEAEALLGVPYTDAKLAPIREIFCKATKVYVYDLGTDGAKTVTDALDALEAYEFNVIAAYTDVSDDVSSYITRVKSWRETLGKNCQAVVYDQASPEHEGIINVVSTVLDDSAPEYALVAWVAGAEAGCPINATCDNVTYDGEYEVDGVKSQSELENCLKNGQFVFHNVYGEVRVLQDINSLTKFTETKTEDFKYNQVIRVLDQIVNDIAKLFNTRYLGKVANNKSGRDGLWGDIVKHHKELETLQAIENFDSSLLKVEQGTTKRSVHVIDAVTVNGAMSHLYLDMIIS